MDDKAKQKADGLVVSPKGDLLGLKTPNGVIKADLSDALFVNLIDKNALRKSIDEKSLYFPAWLKKILNVCNGA
jgi:hypothetical protein